LNNEREEKAPAWGTGAGEGKKTLHHIYSKKTTTYQFMCSKNGQKSVGWICGLIVCAQPAMLIIPELWRALS
jgi:hypothetical protein